MREKGLKETKKNCEKSGEQKASLNVSWESKVHNKARSGCESLTVKNQRLKNNQGYPCKKPDVRRKEWAYGEIEGQLREVSYNLRAPYH